MPENVLEINFKSDKKVKINKSLLASLNNVLSIRKDDLIRTEHFSKKKGSNYTNHISLVGDIPMESENLKSAIRFVESSMLGKSIYIQMYLEQSNYYEYYSVQYGSLLSFKTEKECADFFEQGDWSSPEIEFYDCCDTSKPSFLIRLRFYRKRDIKPFYDLLVKMKDSMVQEDIEKFSNLVLDDNKKYSFTFSEFIKEIDEDQFIGFFNFLTFVSTKDNCLYVGYIFGSDVKIDPVPRGGFCLLGPEENITNKTGRNLSKLVELYDYTGVIGDIQGKFVSPEFGFSGIFYVVAEHLQYRPFWDERRKLPSNYWF